MDRGIWWATVCGVAKSWAGLSDKCTHMRTHCVITRHTCFSVTAFSKACVTICLPLEVVDINKVLFVKRLANGMLYL